MKNTLKEYTVQELEAMDFVDNYIFHKLQQCSRLYFKNPNLPDKTEMLFIELAQVISDISGSNIYIYGNIKTYIWFLYQKIRYKRSSWIWKECICEDISNIIIKYLSTEQAIQDLAPLAKLGLGLEDIYDAYFNIKLIKKRLRKEK